MDAMSDAPHPLIIALGAVAVAVVPRTQATNPLPIKLSGLYARTLSLVLGAPVVSQPITVL